MPAPAGPPSPWRRRRCAFAAAGCVAAGEARRAGVRLPAPPCSLHFHKNADGEYHCPVLNKVLPRGGGLVGWWAAVDACVLGLWPTTLALSVCSACAKIKIYFACLQVFTEHTHIVAIKPTGNVYCWEAVEELCVKPKNLRDLLTGKRFFGSNRCRLDRLIVQIKLGSVSIECSTCPPPNATSDRVRASRCAACVCRKGAGPLAPRAEGPRLSFTSRLPPPCLLGLLQMSPSPARTSSTCRWVGAGAGGMLPLPSPTPAPALALWRRLPLPLRLLQPMLQLPPLLLPPTPTPAPLLLLLVLPPLLLMRLLHSPPSLAGPAQPGGAQPGGV